MQKKWPWQSREVTAYGLHALEGYEEFLIVVEFFEATLLSRGYFKKCALLPKMAGPFVQDTVADNHYCRDTSRNVETCEGFTAIELHRLMPLHPLKLRK